MVCPKTERSNYQLFGIRTDFIFIFIFILIGAKNEDILNRC